MPSTLAALKAALSVAQQYNTLKALEEAAEIKAEMRKAGIL
jgi:hypothetical protein